MFIILYTLYDYNYIKMLSLTAPPPQIKFIDTRN